MALRNDQIPGNQRAFAELCRLHISSEAIAFVGAGASAGLYPLWGDLIGQLIAETVGRGLVAEADQRFWIDLMKTRPQQVVRSIKERLGEGIYGKVLRDIFGPKAWPNGEFHTPIHAALMRLNFRAYVTTNYDPGLLDARASLRDSRAIEFSTWKDDDTINRWITNEIFKEQPCPILFAHGIYDRSDTIVLGSGEYRGAYRAGPYRQLFDKLWSQERLVFVGFGFSDAWLDFLADEVITQIGGRTTAEPRHIAIIGLHEEQPYSQEMRDLYRDQYNATVLFYRIRTKGVGREDHSDLLHVLELVIRSEGGSVVANSSTTSSAPRQLADRQPRVQERVLRLRAMLADHTGFVRDRLESFVGRVRELEEIRRRIEEKLPQGGYLTISGQAGQGKSSVIAKLVEEWGFENVAHHFIPFNPGPDHQISLLRNLMARLIIKYKLSDIYVASESRPVLRDSLSKVLADVTARGGQEVIFIDGLDQLQEDSNGDRDLSFLPNNLPAGIVCVLGTRPNDTLKPLELLKPHEEYRLPDLIRSDFDLILISRKVTLGRDLADRFYSALQANALYLDLVAKELAEAEEIDQASLIQRLAVNPDNIFSLTMDRLKRQREQWREVIKPMLGLLLAARVPLGQLALRQLLRVDGQTLRDGLQKLGGLLTRDVKGRYHLFHLKLRDFLRQDEQRPEKPHIFDIDEEAQWHSCLADWCEAGEGGLTSIWQDDKRDAEQERRIYAREHYIIHLYMAKNWETLWDVLDAGVYGKAKVHYDPSTRSYVNDLRLGCHTLTDEGLSTAEKRVQLPRLWRYVLLHSSLSGKAKLYPEELFTLLVLKHRDREAIELVEFLPRPETKVVALCRIGQALGYAGQSREALTTIQRAADIAQDVKDKWEHATVYRMLSRTLAELGEWDEAVKIAYRLGDSIGRVDTLIMVAQELAAAGEKERFEQLSDNIKQLAGLIGYNWDDEATWHMMIRILKGSDDWDPIINDTWRPNKPKPSDKAMMMLSKALIGAGHLKVARSMVYVIEEAHYQSEILVSVVKELTKVDDRHSVLDLLAEMIDSARVGEGPEKINTLISAALLYSAIGSREVAIRLLANSLSNIQVVDDSSEQIQTLVTFAEEIADLSGLDYARPPLREAERLALRITDGETKGTNLKVIADAYARLGDNVAATRLYTQIGGAPLALLGSGFIEEIVNTLEAQGYWQQAINLSMTDNYLEQLVQQKKWNDAIKAAREGTTPQRRAAQIAVVARAVSRIGEADLALTFLKEALGVATGISTQKNRIQVYISIVGVAAELRSVDDVIRLSQEVIASTNFFPEPKEKAEVLYQIAMALHRVGLNDFGLTIINDMMKIVANVSDYTVRSHASRKLSNAMTRYEDFDRLIDLIQQDWLRVALRDEVLKLLPSVAGLISRDQKTICAFTQSFTWVDDFLEVT